MYCTHAPGPSRAGRTDAGGVGRGANAAGSAGGAGGATGADTRWPTETFSFFGVGSFTGKKETSSGVASVTVSAFSVTCDKPWSWFFAVTASAVDRK